MHFLLKYIRLGLAGLLLEQHIYYQQREAPDRFQQGFLLVLTIGVLVGSAIFLGNAVEWATSPNKTVFQTTLYEELTTMPWYTNQESTLPGFEERFRQEFYQFAPWILQLTRGGDIVQNILIVLLGELLGGIAGLVVIPLIYVVQWALYGVVAHGIARMFGGGGTLDQTLGCLALASGANLLSVVQLFPFAEAAGILLIGLIGSYIAIRVVHEISPGRAFWATVLGPLVFLVLVTGIWFFIVSSVLSGAGN